MRGSTMETVHRVVRNGRGYRRKLGITSCAWLLACLAIALPGSSPGNQSSQPSAAAHVAASAQLGADSLSPQWAAALQPAELRGAVQECIVVAREFGYRNGQCAHAFIEACLTGSPSRVMQEYQVDRTRDMVTASSCSSMPASYRAAFNRF